MSLKSILRLCPLLILYCAGRCYATIAAAANFTSGNPGSATVCTTGSATATTGDTIVVTVQIRTATSTVSSITQSAGSNTYTFQSAASGNNTVRVEIWTAFNITGGTFTISANLAAASKVVCHAVDYSGVNSIGAVTFATASAANPSFSLTVGASTSWCVAGFAGQTTGTFTALTGTLRGSAVSSGGSAASNVGGAHVDNTGSTTCTMAVTNTDTVWALGAVELSLSSPPSCTGNLISLLGAGCK